VLTALRAQAAPHPRSTAGSQAPAGRTAEQPLIAALPGSRRHVVETMLPLQFDVWKRLCSLRPAPRLAISAADEPRLEWVQRFLFNRGYGSRVWRPGRATATLEPTSDARRWIDVVVDDNTSLLASANLVLVASGTATLEVAYYRKPMIVMYDAGPAFAAGHRAIGRWIVHTPHLSLVNILAGRRVVPEFMPSVPSTEAVAQVATDLLDDVTWRTLMERQIDETVRDLEGSQASGRVCDLIVEVVRSGGRST
jgi:lipid-A-disaccharide synthase